MRKFPAIQYIGLLLNFYIPFQTANMYVYTADEQHLALGALVSIESHMPFTLVRDASLLVFYYISVTYNPAKPYLS